MEIPPEHLRDLEALQACITSLPPEWRVKVGALLADTKVRGWLVAEADAATSELATQYTYNEVAQLLGVSVGMVYRRISRHHERNG